MTRTLLYSVVVALSSTVCYLNSLDGEFAYDDGAAIVKNLDVSGTTTNLTAIWTHDFWGQQLSNESSHKSYRPLTTMTFRLDHQLHGGKPRPFHVFNLVCHVLVSLLVFFLCTHILAEGSPTWTEQELSEGGGGEERRGRKGEGKAKAEEKSERVSGLERNRAVLSSSMWSGVLFGTHPVHSEAVSNIVGRSELLSALFFLLAFLAYRRIHGGGGSASVFASVSWFLLSALLWTAAILCKETALTWIGVTLISDLLLLFSSSPSSPSSSSSPCSSTTLPSSSSKSSSSPPPPRRPFLLLLLRFLLLAIVPAVYLACKRALTGASFLPPIAVIDNSAHNAPSPLARTLSILNTHAMYLWKVVYPGHLSCDYSRNVVPNIVALSSPLNMRWVTAYALLLLLLRLALLLLFRRPRPDPRLLHCLLWLALPFGLSANILFPVATVVGERLLYLPSVGWCMFLGYLHLLGAGSGRHVAANSVLLVLAGLYGGRTWIRNPVWHSTLALFQAHVSIVPDSVRMNHGLALEFARHDRHKEALPYFDRAIKLMQDKAFNQGIRDNGDASEAHTLAQYLFEKGNSLSELEEAQAALVQYDKAVALRPDRYAYQNRLAFSLVQSRQYQRGFEAFLACFSLRPTEADMVNNLGNVYMATGRGELAVRSYRLAHRLAPSQTDSLYNMAVLLLRTPGRVLEGVRALREAIHLDPKDEDLRQTLAQALRMIAKQRP